MKSDKSVEKLRRIEKILTDRKDVLLTEEEAYEFLDISSFEFEEYFINSFAHLGNKGKKYYSQNELSLSLLKSVIFNFNFKLTDEDLRSAYERAFHNYLHRTARESMNNLRDELSL